MAKENSKQDMKAMNIVYIFSILLVKSEFPYPIVNIAINAK